MFTQSQEGLLAELAAVIAGVLDGAGPTHTTIKLAQAPFAPTPTSDPGTFTEADFDGYADKTIAAWETPYITGSNGAKTNATALQTWTPTGTTTGNVIAGYWLEAADGTYLGGEAFSAPINVTGPTTPVNLVVSFAISQANFSATVIP